MKRTKGTQGQSVSEYALIVSVAAIAAVSTMTYMRRAIQGYVKQMTDHVLVKSNKIGIVNVTPEEAQTLGIDTQDPGTGINGTDVVVRRNTATDQNNVESRLGFGSVMRDSLVTSRHIETKARSNYFDKSDIPADFALRERVFKQLGKDLGDIDWIAPLPNGPDNPEQPDAPDEPPAEGPTPGGS